MLISKRAWWTTLLYVAAAAMFLRFYELALKPLHHDEGVNTLFLVRLVEAPHFYEYDPANYHGPTLYYFGWLSASVLGLTTVAIRFVTAVAGMISVALVLALRRQLGPVAVLCAAALFAVSPGAVYFSRYYIHEALLVCFTLGTVVAATLWWDGRRTVYLLLAAVSAALMFATKETAVISAAVLIGAGAGTLVLLDRSDRARRLVPDDRAAWPRFWPWLSAATLFFLVTLLFYTSLFSHWQGAADAVQSFGIWTKTGTSEHTHGWHTYVRLLADEELSLLLLGSTGMVVALWRRESRLAVYVALWALGTLIVYSAIPYKTPWLALNVIAPLAICGGYACQAAWAYQRRLARGILVFGFAILIAFAAFRSVVLNFVEYDNDKHPYVYAHTFRDVLGLVDEIRAIETRNPRSSIAVTSREHFPLSWYLREYPAGFYGRPVVTGDPMVIASAEQQSFFDQALGGRYRRVGAYRLRPGVQLVFYARRDLRQ